MNKKFIAFMMSCAMMFGVFGCSGTTKYNADATKNNSNINNNSSVDTDLKDMGSAAADPTYPYSFDYSGNYRSNTHQNIGYNIVPTKKDYYEGTDVYTSIRRMKNIEDVKVIIRDRNAYVGIKTNKNKTLTQNQRRRIKTIIKKKYSRVRNVYFSRDRKGYATLGDRIENGLVDITDDVLSLFDLR